MRQVRPLSERIVVVPCELRTVHWPSLKLRNERQNNFSSRLQVCVETKRDPWFKRQTNTIFNNRTTTNSQIKDIDCLFFKRRFLTVAMLALTWLE
jgi:hypothetical protein